MRKGFIARLGVVAAVMLAPLAFGAPSASANLPDPNGLQFVIPNVTDSKGKYGLQQGDISAGVAPSAMCPAPEATASPTPSSSPSASPSPSATSGAELVTNEASASPSPTADADCLKWPTVKLEANGKCRIDMRIHNPNNYMVPFQIWARVAPDAAPAELTVLVGAWFPANFEEKGVADLRGVDTGGTFEFWVGLWHGKKQQITYGELKNFHFRPSDCPAPRQRAAARNDDGSSASAEVQLAASGNSNSNSNSGSSQQPATPAPTSASPTPSEAFFAGDQDDAVAAPAMDPVSNDQPFNRWGLVAAGAASLIAALLFVGYRMRRSLMANHSN